MAQLGDYQITRALGAGGMAKVFAAHHRQLGRPVAIKMLGDGATDPDDLARFRREAQVVAGLSHPNIITIYETGSAGGRPFIVMELFEGGSLEGLLRQRGRLPADEAIRLMLPLLDALEHAHARGLVHRDIKPANVLLRADGSPVLADFDLARPRSPDPQARITAKGELLGTPAYMAPEQLRGEELDARADIYACGAMLYELLVGAPPFDGDLPQQITGHLQQPPPPLRAREPTVPPALERLVLQMLAKAPEARPRSAADVSRELRAIRDGPAATGKTIALAPPPAQRWSSISTATLIVSTLSGIILLVVLGIVATRSTSTSSSAAPPEAATSEPPTQPIVVATPAPTPRLSEEVAPLSLPRLDAAPMADAQPAAGGGGSFSVGGVSLQIVEEAQLALVYGELRNDGSAPQSGVRVRVALLDAGGEKLLDAEGLVAATALAPGAAGAFVAVGIPSNPEALAGIQSYALTVDGSVEVPEMPGAEALAVDGIVIERLPEYVLPQYRVRGEVRNISDRSIDGSRVTVVFYDAEGRVISLESTDASLTGDAALEPGASAAFEVRALSFGGEPASYRAYADGRWASP